MTYQLTKSNLNISGEISLDGSKSISNRALIIRALCGQDFPIEHLSTSKDTVTMQALLSSQETILDTGAAGTTFRFLTAYLALQNGTQILTGSARMKQRPIGVLVDALCKLGASIEYLEREGYPPLKIHAPNIGQTNQLQITANVSSQYISALLMIAPSLPNGLELQLSSNIVSRPYIEMTLNLMAHFGVQHEWGEAGIRIKQQVYQARPFKVEADWSAASYHYALATFADQLDLQLNGVEANSVQGDAILVEMMEQFGIQSTFNDKGVHLQKSGKSNVSLFEWDFIRCPDIAQTLAVVCGGLGIQGIFTGLETLRIKETDRIAALQEELAKVEVQFSPLPARLAKNPDQEYFLVEGEAQPTQARFATYEDHRMAMAFAPLAMLGSITIEHPMVVVKSYPRYWEDLKVLGFEVEEIIKQP